MSETTTKDVTERKKTEEVLKTLFVRQEALLGAIPDIIMEVDNNKVYTWANQAGFEFFGKDVIGKEAVYYFEGEQDTYNVVQPLFYGSENVIYLESWQRRWDGQKRLLAWWCRVLKDGSGNVTGALSSARDITERKRAEEELRRSEETARWLAQENAIMAEIGRIISSTLDIDEVYGRFSEEVCKLIPFGRIGISMINPEEATLTIVYNTGIEVADRRVGDVLPLAGSGAEVVLKTSSGVILETENREELAERFPGLLTTFDAGFRTMMFVPLTSKGQVIGILSFRYTEPNAYTDRHLNLAERVGHHIAGAVQNARFFNDRLKAQEALKASEAKYRQLHESMRDGFVNVDMDGRIQEFNEIYQNMLGYEREELLVLTYVDLTPEKWHSLEGEIVDKQILRRDYSDIYEKEYRRKDGTLFPVELRTILLRDDAGKPASMWAVVRDITERKQAERVLVESEQRYRSLFENMLEGCACCRMFFDENNRPVDFEYLDVNSAFEKLTGLKNVAGKKVSEVIPGIRESDPELFEIYGRVALTGIPERFERYVKALEMWFSISVYTPGNECFVAVFDVITERKRAEEELRRSEEAAKRLAQENEIMAEIGRIISSTLDIDEVYGRFSEEVCKLIPFGRIGISVINPQQTTFTIAYNTGIEVAGRRVGGVFPVAGSGAEVVLKTSSGVILETENREELAERFPGLLSTFDAGFRTMMFVPLTSKGEVIGILAFRHTEPNTYIEKHLKLAERVGQQIAGAIASAHLFTERKRADEQIKASLVEKEVLLKEIHHRVKNNLQVISSLLKLQSQHTKEKGDQEIFKECQNRVKSMALVHEKLYRSGDLSKIDFAEYVHNLATHVFRSYQASLGNVGLILNVDKISFAIDVAIPLGLLVNELLSNCLKHGFPNGRNGEVQVSLRSDGACQCTLSVSDNGVGLPVGIDFQKTETLGLQLVNTLTGQLGGAIEILRNEGTEFRITFPS